MQNEHVIKAKCLSQERNTITNQQVMCQPCSHGLYPQLVRKGWGEESKGKGPGNEIGYVCIEMKIKYYHFLTQQ